MNWLWYLILPFILFILVALQSSLFPYIPIVGITIQIVPVFLIGLALYRATPELLICAFFAGILLDLLSLVVLGSSTLSLLCALIVIYPFSRAIERYRLFSSFVLGIIGMLVYFFANNLTLRFMGYSLDWNTMAIVPRSAFIHAVGAVIVSLIFSGGSDLFSRNTRRNRSFL